MWRKRNILAKRSYYIPSGNVFIIIFNKTDSKQEKQMLSIACQVLFTMCWHSFPKPAVYLKPSDDKSMLWTLSASHNDRVDYYDLENEVSSAYERNEYMVPFHPFDRRHFNKTDNSQISPVMCVIWGWVQSLRVPL